MSKCEACSAALPPRVPGRRGRPQLYCLNSTGRPCGQWARVLSQLSSLSDKIAENAAPAIGERRVRLKIGGKVIRYGNDVKYQTL